MTNFLYFLSFPTLFKSLQRFTIRQKVVSLNLVFFVYFLLVVAIRTSWRKWTQLATKDVLNCSRQRLTVNWRATNKSRNPNTPTGHMRKYVLCAATRAAVRAKRKARSNGAGEWKRKRMKKISSPLVVSAFSSSPRVSLCSSDACAMCICSVRLVIYW